MLVAPDMPITTTYRVTGSRLSESHRTLGDYSISLYGNLGTRADSPTITSSLYLTEQDALALRKVLNRLLPGASSADKVTVLIQDGVVTEKEDR